MTVDERLLKSFDRLTWVRKIPRSAFIRDALAAEIRHARISEQEARHIACTRGKLRQAERLLCYGILQVDSRARMLA
jgi:metal-responsive CopG/Arc/MetJ family transcriptional regulator